MIQIKKQDYIASRADLNNDGRISGEVELAEANIAEGELETLDVDGDNVLSDRDLVASDGLLSSHFERLRPDSFDRALARLAPAAEQARKQGKTDLQQGLLAYRQRLESRRDLWAIKQATELRDEHSSWTGLDEEAFAAKLQKLIRTEPLAAAAIIEVMARGEVVSAGDRREIFAHILGAKPAALDLLALGAGLTPLLLDGCARFSGLDTSALAGWLASLAQQCPDRRLSEVGKVIEATLDRVTFLARVEVAKNLGAQLGQRLELLPLSTYRNIHAAAPVDLVAFDPTLPDATFDAVAKAVGMTTEPCIVAVLDTGFVIDDPAIANSLWANPGEKENGLDDDGDGRVDDYHGYNFVEDKSEFTPPQSWGRTPPASKVHANGMMRLIQSGATNVETMALQVVGADPGRFGDVLEDAIEYAISHGAKVINMSFGNSADGVERTQRLIRAHPDIVFVKSAGNQAALVGGPKLEASAKDLTADPRSHLNHDVTLGAPGPNDLAAFSAPNLVVVAAGVESGAKLPASSYSPTKVAFAASGILGSYEGTSHAAANTSNTVAKILVICPSLKPAEVQRVIAATADISPASPWREWVREGVVNRARALRLAGLIALTRGGKTPAEAADRLSLRGAERQWLLGKLSEF